MKTALILASVIIFYSNPAIRAFNGVSAGIGMEYIPTAKLSYPNSGGAEYEIVDNVTWEPGLYYNFATGSSLISTSTPDSTFSGSVLSISSLLICLSFRIDCLNPDIWGRKI